MKQTAVEYIEEKIKKYHELYFVMSLWFEDAKEMEQQQQGYSEEEVELIANEMVNWAIDNIGNPFPQSGKKFDEVIAKFKNKQVMNIRKLETRQSWLCEVDGTTYVRTEIKWTHDRPNDITWHLNEDQVEGRVYLTDEQLEKLFWLNDVKLNIPL